MVCFIVLPIYYLWATIYSIVMSTTAVGRAVEAAVAKNLSIKGYVLKDQNWRTRWCEIDLVMEKKGVIFFIEVKFRRNSHAGEGFEYVTPKKLSQMQYASKFWCAKNKWDGDCQLLVASVDGDKSTIKLIEVE